MPKPGNCSINFKKEQLSYLLIRGEASLVSGMCCAFPARLDEWSCCSGMSPMSRGRFCSISGRAAFPFKSDSKLTLGCNVDHAGYAFQLLWFKESAQLGWLRQPPTNVFAQIALPPQTNLDFHLSKKFELGKLKLFANFSGRNLLNNEVILQGLALLAGSPLLFDRRRAILSRTIA